MNMGNDNHITIRANGHKHKLMIPHGASLQHLVALYQKLCRYYLRENLEGFMRQEFGEALKLAALGKESNGQHMDHLCCLESAAMAEALAKLSAKSKELANYKTFDDLYNAIVKYVQGIDGLGPMYFYDVALRLGVCQGLWPSKVYLQRGAQAGATHLNLTSQSNNLEYSAFPSELHCLNAVEIEDFLCIFQKQLEDLNSK